MKLSLGRVLTVCSWLVGPGLTMASHADAFGLGAYGLIGGGTGQTTTESPRGDIDDDKTSRQYGVGFALDTALRDERTFNYRLNLGYESVSVAADEGYDADLRGVTLANDFGFAFVRSEALRVWAGPELRLGYYVGDNDADNDLSLFAAGLGVVVGGNVGVGRTVVLGLKVGLVYSGLWGSSDDGEDTWDINGHLIQYFLNGSVFFDL